MDGVHVNACRLCSMLSDPLHTGELRICDIPFRKSNSFIVVPALGPLCIGHAMIVSRDHCVSLLSMDLPAREEFLAESITLQGAWSGEALTFAEHGASCSDESGPCIAHTHVNVIPGAGEGLLRLEHLGHELLASGSLMSMPYVHDGYFLIGQADTWRLYSSASAPSQHLRQLLYKSFGLDHWDWRLAPNMEQAAVTSERWQSLLSQHTP
jgi:hypothetical protein